VWQGRLEEWDVMTGKCGYKEGRGEGGGWYWGGVCFWGSAWEAWCNVGSRREGHAGSCLYLLILAVLALYYISQQI